MKNILAALCVLFAATTARAQFHMYDTCDVMALATNATITTTSGSVITTNATIGINNYVGQAIAILNYSQSAGTNASMVVKLQTGDLSGTNVVWADVTGGTFSTITNINPGDSALLKLNIKGTSFSKYARAVQTLTAADTNTVTFSTSVTLIARRKYN